MVRGLDYDSARGTALVYGFGYDLIMAALVLRFVTSHL